MRGIIFAGAERPESDKLREIAKGADILVAADSGLIAAEDAGLKVDWVVGDMDSLSSVDTNYHIRLEKYPPEKVLRFPPDKDFTDTELAFNLLREKGCDEIWLTGGGGGRIDHLLAIRSLFERENHPDRWFPGNVEIRSVKKGQTLSAVLPPESLVSVFPSGVKPWEAESSGLKWPLKGLSWNPGSFSLSNVAINGPFEIRSIQGRFLVFMEHIPKL